MTAYLFCGFALLIGGPAFLWRMADWGSTFGPPPRLGGVALLTLAVVGAWMEFGAISGLLVALLALGMFAVALMATPRALRRANLFRSRDVREAVANSRTLWESFDYRQSDSK